MEDSVFSVTFDENFSVLEPCASPGLAGGGGGGGSGGDSGLHASGGAPIAGCSPNKTTSPYRGRTMKEYEELLAQLRKENFNLKVRIYFLEERSPGREVGHNGGRGGDPEAAERDELLLQAARAVQLMEDQHRAQLAALHAQLRQREQEQAEPESEHLRTQLQQQRERADDLYAQLAEQRKRTQQLETQQEVLTEQLTEQLTQHLSDKLSGELIEQRRRAEELAQELTEQRRTNELQLEERASAARLQEQKLAGELQAALQQAEQRAEQLKAERKQAERLKAQLQAHLQAQPAPTSPVQGAGERLQLVVSRTQEQLQQLECELVDVRAELRKQTCMRAELEARYERSVHVIHEMARLGRAQEQQAERTRLQAEALAAELARKQEQCPNTPETTPAKALNKVSAETAPSLAAEQQHKSREQDKDAEIARLNAELRKRNTNLQELVNKELWDRNREIARLQQGRLREPPEREQDGVIPGLPPPASGPALYQGVDVGLLAALARAEAGRREAADACSTLGRSLEQVAAGMLALVHRGDLLLAPERQRALEKAARAGLRLSRALPMVIRQVEPGPELGQALRRCQSAGALPASPHAATCGSPELESELWVHGDLWTTEPWAKQQGAGGSGEASAEDSGSEASAGLGARAGRRLRGRRMRSDPGPVLTHQSAAVQTSSSEGDGASAAPDLPLLQLVEAQTMVEQLRERVSDLEMHLKEKDNEVLERQCALLEARTECEERCVQAQEQMRQLEAAAKRQEQELEAEKSRARHQVQEAERLGAEFAAGLRQQVEEAQAVYTKVQARVLEMESAHKAREAELRRAMAGAELRLREAEAALRRQRDAAAEAESAAALERTRLEHDRLQLERTLRRQQQPHAQRKLSTLEQQVAQLSCGSPPLHLCLTDSTEQLLLPNQKGDGGSLSSGLDSYSVDGISLTGSVWSSHSVRVPDYLCDDSLHQLVGGPGSPDLGIGSDHGQCSSLETGCVLTGSDSDVDSAEEPAARPDSKVLESETERLRCENETLKKNLSRTKRLLEATVAQLTSSNQLKRQMERAICRQLHRTQRVLQQARGDRCVP